MSVFTPVQQFANLVTYHWLSLVPQSYLAEAISFFIYDVIKIGILMLFINTLVTVIGYYFPLEKVRSILTKKRWYGLDYLLAALLGIVTPFCSCSSIPLFIGFIAAKIPLGVTFAFLISSPLINEASLYLFPSIFGLKVTVIYNLIGIMIAVFAGFLIEKLHLEKYIRSEFTSFKSRQEIELEYQGSKIPFSNLIKIWREQVWSITKKVFPYILIGVGIGALIHGYVPETLISQFLAQKTWWVIPTAVVLGVPLYANSISIVPIAEALVGKGVPLGTILSFMTATVTLSIPEALMLSKIMKKELLFAFFAITTLGIIFLGYLFNFIF